MLDAVAGNFLQTITEREFDAPFMALLRAHGYYDIHFLHGSFEFGKDYIARRLENGVECQFVFQAKAGNLGLGEWTQGLGQIEMLRRNRYAHPSFDANLPRRAVFMTTGRLVGGAALEAQDYCQQSSTNGTPLAIWDRERLIEMLVAAIGSGLVERVEAPLLATVASASTNKLTDADLERFSQRWCLENQDSAACTLEAALVTTFLHQNRRDDLAALCGLALVRAACWQTHGLDRVDRSWDEANSLGKHIFATYVDLLLDRLGPNGGPEADELVRFHIEPGSMIVHAVRSVRIAELVGLLGLLGPNPATTRSRRDLAVWVAKFVARQPASRSPISDRWAVAIIPPALLLSGEGLTEDVDNYLREISIWLFQRYRFGDGLADASSRPKDEIRQLVRRALPQPGLARRDESFLAAVLLDLLAFFRRDRLYAFVRDDLRLAKALPSFTATTDSSDQYLLDGAGIGVERNARYEDALNDQWTSAAPHLPMAAARRHLQQASRSWDHLAVSALLRDRHFVCAWS